MTDEPVAETAPVVAPKMLVSPATGEVLELTAPTDELARVLDETRDIEQQLRGYKQHIADEIHRRMDAEGVWTAHVGDYTVTGQSPARTTYNAELLRASLAALVLDGTITEDARDRAVTVVETLKVSARGTQALHKLGGAVASVIDESEQPVDTPRRVSVKRRSTL